jgi:hypothetical protein
MDDVPESVRSQLDVRFVADVADVVRGALEPAAGVAEATAAA